MTSATTDNATPSAGFKTCLSHNRLGDLLVGSGHITSAQLNDALKLQKQTGFALGVILKEQGLVSTGTLRFALTQQVAWRSMAACLAFLIGFSALGIQSARATSATVQETGSISKPEGGTLQEVSINRNAIPSPKTAYQSLFGTDEVRSADISPFTKWTGIMRRLNPSSNCMATGCRLKNLPPM